MELLVNVTQFLVSDVSIYLGGGDRTVAEHHLDTSNVSAVLEQISRE